MSENSVASRMVSGGAAATGAVASDDSERTSDTASDTTAESRQSAFTRFGLERTSRCRNLASPRYDGAVLRGASNPACRMMARVFAAPARVQYHSQAAAETTRLVPSVPASVLRFTRAEPGGSNHQTAPRRWSGRARPSSIRRSAI